VKGAGLWISRASKRCGYAPSEFIIGASDFDAQITFRKDDENLRLVNTKDFSVVACIWTF
jgi:hypothetical protein